MSGLQGCKVSTGLQSAKNDELFARTDAVRTVRVSPPPHDAHC